VHKQLKTFAHLLCISDDLCVLLFLIFFCLEVFVRTDEYVKAYDFANVKPGDNQAKITFCLKVIFADSIATV